MERIYQNLPTFLQNVAVNIEGLRIQRTRYGKGFRIALAEAESRATQGAEFLRTFRDQRLQRFVKHAVETTPYYRDLFYKLKLSADDIRTLEDIKALPVLTKDEVKEAPERFMSAAVPRRQHVQCHTSGTTGGGFRFVTTVTAHQEQWAIWWRYWRLHGIQRGTWCGYFGGRSIVPVAQKTSPYWRINIPGRQVLFSAYHTSPENLTLYLEKIRQLRPPWLHGYPSQLSLIASHILETGFELGYYPDWVTIGAENLLPQQSSLIRRAFGRDPIQHYGMAEAVANISQCSHGALHVDEDFAAVEFLPGTSGTTKLIGSNMSNLAMPLLRYDVGDNAELADYCCKCGRPGRIVASLDGRLEDYVVTAQRVKIGRLDHVFKDLTHVREAQIRQSAPGFVTVLVVPAPEFTNNDEALLRQEFASRLGNDTEISIQYVEAIARTRNGKLRLVVNEIPDAQLETKLPPTARPQG